MNSFKLKPWLVFAVILIVELFSFFGYIFPQFDQVAFFIIIALAIVATMEDLALGVLLLLTELFLGSKGYLFYLDICDYHLSWRIALWVVVMGVWAYKALRRYFKQKEEFLSVEIKDSLQPYLLLWALAGLGAVNGLIRRHHLNNWFSDLNAWLYFTLFFPFYEVFAGENAKANWAKLKIVFLSAMYFLCFKTIAVFLIIKYGGGDFSWDIYRWVRTTGVGEVTFTDAGFYRTFFQSQIFLVGAILLNLFSYIKNIGQSWKKNWVYYFNFIIFGTTIIISLSRSFWFGLGLALVAALVMIWFREKRKVFFRVLLLGFVSLIASVALTSLISWSWPATFLLRAGIDNNEPATASRWALLEKINLEIKQEPFLGQGYGATISYLSHDPRINGLYTTYALEWGWLDVWLKLGFFGLVAYLYIFGINIYYGLKSKDRLLHGLALGLLALALVNIFSPYVNHPLGIGFLLLASLAIVSRGKIG